MNSEGRDPGPPSAESMSRLNTEGPSDVMTIRVAAIRCPISEPRVCHEGSPLHQMQGLHRSEPMQKTNETHSMTVAWLTDTGRVRRNNEDGILVDVSRGVFLLADGMGGHNAGEIASSLAIRVAYEYLGRKTADRPVKKEAIPGLLMEAINQANLVVQESSMSTPELAGMGTTLVAMMIRGDEAHICHVGDSRAYLLRGRLLRLTQDHSLGGTLVERNILPFEQVPSEFWHILTQVVGITTDLDPGMTRVALQPGDVVLLCSDGLTRALSDGDIGDALVANRGDLRKAASLLVREANNRGGSDNTSVVLARIDRCPVDVLLLPGARADSADPAGQAPHRGPDPTRRGIAWP